ncbi:prenylated rab acceptor PRA1, partial [Blyttiomyces helicus]
ENIKEQARSRLAGLKPVSDFFDRTRMSRPSSINVFSTRLAFNLHHFQNNYILFVAVMTFYLLFTNLWLLATIIFLLIGFKFISALPANEPATLPGGIVVTSSQLWPIYGFTSLLLLWFTSAGGAIFWLASVCVVLILIHAGIMEPPVEADFAEEQV